VPISVPARRRQASLYDADGRATAQLSMVGNNKESLAWFGSAAIASGYIDILGQHIQVSGSNGGYDSNGVLLGYQTKVWDAVAFDNRELYRSQHSFNYLTGAGGRVEQTHTVSNTRITTVSTDQTPMSGSTTRTYNVNGELIKFVDSNVPAVNRFFANNQQGQAITAIQGNYQPSELSTKFSNALSGQGGINSTRARHSFFANGEFVGSVGQVTGHLAANFDVNYTAISDDYPATVPSTYIVQRGDTLRTVAQRVFGDASLWYVIAEANGYDSDEVVLDDGIALTIPNTVVAQSNTASSFKPFNFSEVIGDTTPIQPLPPRTPKGCGIIGQIFIMVLAALVIYATWGWGAGVGNAIANAATGAAVGTTTTAGAVIGGAIAGTIGSAVSQGVAIGAGLQENFNWKSLAMSAIASGVTAGVNASFLKDLKLPQADITRPMLTAATSSVITQGVAVLTDLQESFSWRQVAISAVSAPLVQYVGENVGGITGFEFLGDMAGSLSGSLVRRAFDENVETEQMWADAFGNALASGLIRQMEALPSTAARRMTDRIKEDLAGSLTEEERANLPGFQRFAASQIEQARQLEATDPIAADRLMDGVIKKALGFYPPGEVAAAEALLRPVMPDDDFDQSPVGPSTGVNGGELERVEIPGREEFGLALGLLDRPAIQTGRLMSRIEGEVQSWVENTPGAGLALTIIDWGTTIAGGPARYVADRGLEAAEEEIEEKITGQFRSSGYAEQKAEEGGGGATTLLQAAGTLLLGVVRRKKSNRDFQPTKPTGKRGDIKGNLSGRRKEQEVVENAMADFYAHEGYRVHQSPALSAKQREELQIPSRNPDFLIEGRPFDLYTADSNSVRSIYDRMGEKVVSGPRHQADRLVVDLRASSVSKGELEKYLRQNPLKGLNELHVVTTDWLGNTVIRVVKRQ
jgi:hypothetical protein